MCFPYPGTHITRDMNFPYPETRITRDMSFPGRETNATKARVLEICVRGNTYCGETHIIITLTSQWYSCSTVTRRGSPLYKLSRYVPPHQVGFLRRFGLKTGIQFAHFGLESGIVFEGTEVYELKFKFKFKFIKKNWENTKYDVPLLAVSYSYSRRAVAWH